MVLAISFLEAPLKFRAPGVSIPIGLAIGRLVFKALNTAEAIFSAAIVVLLIVAGPANSVVVALGCAVALLTGQLLFVRPRLSRRSDAVLAGHDAPRSHAHHAYIVLESLKVAALLVGGILILSA
ncbi:MAG TPA: hypothetical protein VHC49_09405 [Mycobacteriales bacterium]|nr:hypothetical protein [Mycobacteriales bacterium]